MVRGKVFITGGAGFLGRGILRCRERESWPCDVTVYSRDEEKQDVLRRRFKDVRCILGDVCDLENLTTAMAGHDIVVHAAALKYIPEAEHNVHECLRVNVDGARNVVLAAAKTGIEKVIGLSTDKACLPVNTYGLTKALLERVFAESSQRWPTRYCSVRYGNVIGSTGSVIPLFKRQAEAGEVLITDKRMTRFWLSVDEAVNLVLFALGHVDEFPGAVFVRRCGAMRVEDLAELLAGPVPVREVGARPGEKTDETLIHYQESVRVVEREGHYVLLPLTAGPEDTKVPWSYASHTPGHWISRNEMATAVEDAEEL